MLKVDTNAKRTQSSGQADILLDEEIKIFSDFNPFLKIYKFILIGG